MEDGKRRGLDMWDRIKRLFRKKDKSLSVLLVKTPNVRHVGTGRKKNTIYPVDELAEQHMDEWLDDVFQKHHG